MQRRRMTEKERTYIAIDLKSFYASVECKERNRDPLTTNLVVADKSRTEKTICLAVSPALKCYGIPGRARLFEVVQNPKPRIKDVLKSKKIPEGLVADKKETVITVDSGACDAVCPPHAFDTRLQAGQRMLHRAIMVKKQCK